MFVFVYPSLLFNFLLLTSFHFIFIYTTALCLRTSHNEMKWLYLHIDICTQQSSLEYFFIICSTPPMKITTRWHTTPTSLSSSLAESEGKKKKSSIFVCLYVATSRANNTGVSFMWRWITNQILKAGVKKITVMGARERKMNWTTHKSSAKILLE